MRRIGYTIFTAAMLYVLVPDAPRAIGQVTGEGVNPAASSGDGAEPQPVSTRRQTELLRWRQTFFWGVVLLIVFMISAGVIIRFSIRYRRYLLSGKKSRPTPTEDVWKMHKLPEGAVDRIGDEDRPEK
jgi:hypothetical protein